MSPTSHPSSNGEKTQRSTSEYSSHVKSLLERYPNLRRFHKLLTAEASYEDIHVNRVAVVEIYEGKTEEKHFSSPGDLQKYMEDVSLQTSPTCRHRQYLLEGLAPAYIEVLGANLGADPHVFTEQLRQRTNARETWLLPSQYNSDKYFTLQYVEVREFEEGVEELGSCLLFQDRKIWLTRTPSKADRVGQVHRIASFWSSHTPDGAFNSLVLVDPPVGDIIKVGKSKPKELRKCASIPYQGGYLDISPSTYAHTTIPPGPPRMSLFDDILFYWRHTECFPGLLSNISKGSPARHTSRFLKKLVASHWMQLLSYLDIIFDGLEWALARSDLNRVSGVEGHWNNVEFWHRRCRKSCDQLERALHHLQPRKPASKLDESDADHSLTSGADDDNSIEDFQYLHAQMLGLKKRAKHLCLTLTNLIGIIQSKRSAEEARGVRIITLLGMLFVPLSFTTGLYSMSDAYNPNGDRFWVYFATSLPIVVLVFSVVFAQQVIGRLTVKEIRPLTFLEKRRAPNYSNHIA